jgi:heterodisulfide reductase subunit A
MLSTAVPGRMSDGSDGRVRVVVIGGGMAGMAASAALAELGHPVSLIERDRSLGGVASHLNCLSPDLRSAAETVALMVEQVLREPRVRTYLGAELASLGYDGQGFFIELVDGERVEGDAVVMATGLEEVPTAPIPEYGHGLRDGVITSRELERYALRGPIAEETVRSVVFIQCVGSRTERRGVPYCSALCCANAVKNALAVKREDPRREVAVLYIDMRTSGVGQEALYREARRCGVRFIRGQPSLVLERDGRLVVCGENTLLRELYEIPADLVVLSTGMRQSPSNLLLLDELGVAQGTWGFPSVTGSRTSSKGVFIAGSAKGPMDLPTTVGDARACALDVHHFLHEKRKYG